MLTGRPRARGRGQAGLAPALAERRSVAAMEFALIAPIIATLTVGVFDIGRALIVWQQINNAAEAIAEAAEKISITVGTDGTTATTLTPQQMQDAMTSIYAQVPGLNLGMGTGIFKGKFSVTLSDVVYYPVCAMADVSQCGNQAQAPYTAWTTYLTQGGPQLMTPSVNNTLQRPCYPTALIPKSQFPNNSTELQVMVNPTIVTKGVSMTLTPQVVADVSYVFVPNFPFFMPKAGFTLWASATLPSPFGGLTQQVTLNAPAGTYNSASNPALCPIPPGN